MRILLLFIFAFVSFTRVHGQDIPLFSQKLTNSFLYNPAMAGHSFGSLTTSYRTNYSGVSGAPKNYFLSLQTPFNNGRFGIGANVFQEKVNVMDNMYFSGAFAYHLPIGLFQTISMGVGVEYNMLRLDMSKLNLADTDDDVIRRYSGTTGKPDFSFGLLYQNQFIKAGLAANRISTAVQQKDQTSLSNYYSAYVQGMLPMRGEQDLLEPYFSYRKFSDSNNTIDLGLYYTFNDKVTLGGATRNFSVVNASVGLKVTKSLLIGYSGEMIAGNVGGFTGSSSEFTLRLDFNQDARKAKLNAGYKSSLSYRRKTLNTSGVKKTAGGRTPKQLAKAQKRVAAYSPNKRYQNMSKLSGGKKSMAKRPATKKSSPKKRKPVKRRK